MLSTTSSRIGLIVVVAVVVTAVPVGMFLINSSTPAPPTKETVKVTLLYNAGVMIEAKGLRIYIDPTSLSDNCTACPADAILITHDHGDHYDSMIVNTLQKQGTVNVFPKIMTGAISAFSGIGVSPMDHVQVGSINITAFYMYTLPPLGGSASHPKESNYTSYIIDIGGFTIFHAGDSKNIPEYAQLVGKINLAFLPLGPGCQTMYGIEVVDVIELVQPEYMVPIHFAEGTDDAFVIDYGELVEAAGCQIVQLPYFATHTFEV